jgi:hypothetical protein
MENVVGLVYRLVGDAAVLARGLAGGTLDAAGLRIDSTAPLGGGVMGAGYRVTRVLPVGESLVNPDQFSS